MVPLVTETCCELLAFPAEAIKVTVSPASIAYRSIPFVSACSSTSDTVSSVFVSTVFSRCDSESSSLCSVSPVPLSSSTVISEELSDCISVSGSFTVIFLLIL